MTEIQNPNDRNEADRRFCGKGGQLPSVLNFEFRALNLFRISYFGFRISRVPFAFTPREK